MFGLLNYTIHGFELANSVIFNGSTSQTTLLSGLMSSGDFIGKSYEDVQPSEVFNNIRPYLYGAAMPLMWAASGTPFIQDMQVACNDPRPKEYEVDRVITEEYWLHACACDAEMKNTYCLVAIENKDPRPVCQGKLCNHDAQGKFIQVPGWDTLSVYPDKPPEEMKGWSTVAVSSLIRGYVQLNSSFFNERSSLY